MCINTIEEIEYDFYEDFLDDLKPNGKLDILKPSYVFRGQSGDWELLPSALRTTDQNKLSELAFTMDAALFNTQSELFQRNMEYNVLLKFYRHANTIGLKLPHTLFSSDDYSDPESLGNVNKKDVTNEWIPDGLQEIAALAQHYGLPTRLLDWTFDIGVAVYFAAYNSVKDKLRKKVYPEHIKDNIIIWGINYLKLGRAISSPSIKSPPIRFVIPHYSENPNLFAQKGLLSYWKSEKLDLDNNAPLMVCRMPLNDLLASFKSDSRYLNNSPLMYKLIFPANEALKMLKHIVSYGYNAATLFPGYDGVKLRMEEDVMIDKAKKIYEKTTPQKSLIYSTSAREEQNNQNNIPPNITSLDNAPEQNY